MSFKPFIDEVRLHVVAGRGGHGCVSFRRERCVPYGGPDGGDGGRGGSVFLRATRGLNSLADYRYKKKFKAPSGVGGAGRQRAGRSGDDLYLSVPCGTLVIDAETGDAVGELFHDHDTLCVARGGSGGLGNTHFKSSTNRAPRRFTEGEWGEEHLLRLELRMLADVGLLGFPNAGKSSLLRAASAARPKVADYPFTTQKPMLGMVELDAQRAFLMADIPGLLEGASEGVGLGLRFLKHLSRCRLLLHVVSLLDESGEEHVVDDVQAVRQEVLAYGQDLAKTQRWLVINKSDLCPLAEREAWVEQWRASLGDDEPLYLISAQTGEGVRELMQDVANHLSESWPDDLDRLDGAAESRL